MVVLYSSMKISLSGTTANRSGLASSKRTLLRRKGSTWLAVRRAAPAISVLPPMKRAAAHTWATL